MDQQTITTSSPANKALENLRMRLLDLTARNRLINFYHTKRASLRIIDEQPNQLVETLLSDVEMRFVAIPEATEDELIDAGYLRFDEEAQELVELKNTPSAEEWARHLEFATGHEVPECLVEGESDKHTDTAMQTLLYPNEMEVRLKGLLQASESAVQEMGANILYMAFGFLEWYDSANSDSARIAPLFLVPVRLNKGRLNPGTPTYEYTLGYSGEDIIPNLSLREKLRVDFAMALPDLDENTAPEDYLNQVQALIQKAQPCWRVRRYISLTLLNFSKLLMYLDLDPSRWPENANIVDHQVVSRFLSGYDREQDENTSSGDLGFGEEYPIDEMDEVHARYPLVDDADSSQHSALIDAVDGKNLVIEGPPGTGKSQTITNLIAAAMAQRKKVLFVAEKLAALEVVRSRLDNAGLGEFCLELHSHKSQKRKVLDEIEARLKKHGHYRQPKDIEVDIARYEELKTALKKHAEKINQPWKNTGKTRHEIFMAATRYRNAIDINPNTVHPEGCDGESYDAAAQRRNEDIVEVYRKVYQAVARQLGENATLQGHPWFGVRNSELQGFDLDRVKGALGDWQVSLERLVTTNEDIANTLGCDGSVVAESVAQAQGFYDELVSIPALHGDVALDLLPRLQGETLVLAQRYLALFEQIQGQYEILAKVVEPSLLQDLAVVDQLLGGSEQLKHLVGSGVELGGLSEALNRLAAIADQLEQLAEPLEGVVSALGHHADEHMTISESGLAEFKVVIELVASLKPAYWKHRDDCFDGEELDDLLPQLRSDLEELEALHDGVHSAFALERLPSAEEIRQLAATLDEGGLFRWLKGDWRAARKTVMSLSVGGQVKFSTLAPMLNDLAAFVEKRQKFENNAQYQEAVGDHLQGLDTDVTMLESLRDWYKRVRQQYGVGFGRKVALGDAILELSSSAARGVRSLADRGIQYKIGDLIDDLGSLKNVFAPVAELRDDNTLLVGDGGIVPYLRKAVYEAIQACGPLVNDNSLSITDLVDRIEQIGLLRQRVGEWQEINLDRALFQGRLGLTTGLQGDNSDGLSMLRNTLRVASSVDGQISNAALSYYLYENPTTATFSALASHAEVLRDGLAQQQAEYGRFESMVQLDLAGWTRESGERIGDLIRRNVRALRNGEILQNWLEYMRMSDHLAAQGLGKLVVDVELGDFDIEEIEDVYRAGVFDLLAREILSQDPELDRFSGCSQKALQEQFKEYDIKLKNLQCEQIAWKIDQIRVPAGVASARASERTERVLLEHECTKQRRHISIRQLLKRAGDALVALKPCFMMGPMSVAQYLAPGERNFDLVVMDEASQIKPQDALGTVARGDQLVVVGDPKQLPPTSFFDRMVEEEEEDPTGIEESESILDATLPMFPARRLRWHYRSQHESLIAFSNHSFYKSDLVLFPSPHKKTENYGVQYFPVQRGCFVNRRNMEEARVISEAVREHFRHRPDETLGVVAMSAEQRTQIEQAIETLSKKDPAFQEWLDKDSGKRESLFVKNLENVQGDERDVIFISMTYGPQEPGGKVFQRFGPITGNAGWRRLNVLFTRSRKRMHIFSSMGSDDIVAGASSKRGVKALRDFLSYCKTGIPHKTERETGREPDSDFEIAVMNALRDEGFECIPQVGVAGYFIDVAVVDPGTPGRYLMGIECDGTTYHSAKSARDRDRLRQSMLERLGWEIRRIWSTDWFRRNPRGELAPIIRELHKLKTPVIVERPEVQSEVDKIEAIIHKAEAVEGQTELFTADEGSLKESLVRFEREVIRKKFPDTPEGKRLLRPLMLKALLEYAPTNKVEFLEVIPSYLRQATDGVEAKYLDQVFDIINASLEGF